MKILMAIKTLARPGGAERVLAIVASYLADHGHDVLIVTFDKYREAFFYDLERRIAVQTLGIGDARRPARFVETIRRIIGLRRTIAKHRPDVAVGFCYSMFVPLAISAVGTGIGIVASEHIGHEHYRNRVGACGLLLLTAPLIQLITVPTEQIRRNCFYSSRSRVVTLPNPVIKPTGRAAIAAEKSQYVVLNVGRLDSQKDHATLITAFGKVTNSFPNWILRIVGEGPLESELRALSCTLGITAQVNFVGVTKEISSEYRGADIFVLSSTYESFGLVTVEAMLHGLPVIGFRDCEGTNQLIGDEVSGILVEPGSDRISSLAAALRRLMSNQQLRTQLGESAFEQTRDRFSTDTICSAWERLLQSECKIEG